MDKVYYKVVYFDTSDAGEPFERYMNFSDEKFDSIEAARVRLNEFLKFVPFGFIVEISNYSAGVYPIIL